MAQGKEEAQGVRRRRREDHGLLAVAVSNSRRMAAVFWILLWFGVAIISALSALVSTQFKESFRSSGLTLTELEAEVRRQSAEKELASRIRTISASIEESRGKRQLAQTALLRELHPFEEKQNEVARLEDIKIEYRTEANRARITVLRQEITEARPRVQKLDADFRAIDAIYFDARKQYDELLEASRNSPPPPENSAVTTFARDSSYLRNDFFLMRWFFEMPSDLVTLWLALCMGALGSVIYVLRELFDEESEPRSGSWFFMRPFLGMVLAFVMYLLVRTGQTTFTDPAGGPSSLNPFTISFLAVISGLMSDRAYSRIVSAAENVFGPGDSDAPLDPDGIQPDGARQAPDRSTATAASDRA